MDITKSDVAIIGGDVIGRAAAYSLKQSGVERVRRALALNCYV